MRSALQGRNSVAIGAELARPVLGPRDRPFRPAAAVERGLAGERSLADQPGVGKRVPEVVGKPAGKAERVLGGNSGARAAAFFGAAPADFDPLREIGLGSRQRVEPFGLKRRRIAENLRVGMKLNRRSAPVPDASLAFQRSVGLAAAEGLDPKRLVARNLDRHPIAERIDDRNADAVQTARGLIDLVPEFAAGMECGQHDLQGGFVGKLGVRLDRDPTSVVADGDGTVGFEREVDPGSMPRDHLVHGVVEDLGRQMVQSGLVGAADIHARTPAYGFETLENLDVLRRVTLGIQRGFGGGARHWNGKCGSDRSTGKRRIWYPGAPE